MRAARGQRWLQKEDQYLGPHEGQWSSQFSSYGAAGVEQGFLVTMQSQIPRAGGQDFSLALLPESISLL